jgi:hypothetical protein
MIRLAFVVLALSAAATARAEEEFVVVPHPALPGEVPAGTREDQILWRDATDAMGSGNQAIRAANMALYDLHYARLDLDQLEKDAKPDDAKRLKEIRARLEGPAQKVQAAMPRGPLGRCRYEILYFEQSMGGDPGSDLAKRLPEKRVEAKKCLDDHRQVIATLPPATAELRKVLTDVAPDIQTRMAAAHKDSSRTTAAPPPTNGLPGSEPAAATGAAKPEAAPAASEVKL